MGRMSAQRTRVMIVSLALIGVSLAAAITLPYIPNASAFQERVILVVLGLGAAGLVAALIPGLLSWEGQLGGLVLKASGPIVIFLVVLFSESFSPGTLRSPGMPPVDSTGQGGLRSRPQIGVASPIASPFEATSFASSPEATPVYFP